VYLEIEEINEILDSQIATETELMVNHDSEKMFGFVRYQIKIKVLKWVKKLLQQQAVKLRGK
jgi:hypothetical protein